eukprot:UN33959
MNNNNHNNNAFGSSSLFGHNNNNNIFGNNNNNSFSFGNKIKTPRKRATKSRSLLNLMQTANRNKRKIAGLDTEDNEKTRKEEKKKRYNYRAIDIKREIQSKQGWNPKQQTLIVNKKVLESNEKINDLADSTLVRCFVKKKKFLISTQICVVRLGLKEN